MSGNFFSSTNPVMFSLLMLAGIFFILFSGVVRWSHRNRFFNVVTWVVIPLTDMSKTQSASQSARPLKSLPFKGGVGVGFGVANFFL